MKPEFYSTLKRLSFDNEMIDCAPFGPTLSSSDMILLENSQENLNFK